jgi:hypothetical protein
LYLWAAGYAQRRYMVWEMKSLNENIYLRDVFLSHASIDKNDIIKPFVKVLENREITYWLDEAELRWGHSLLEQISNGLQKSEFVIVFITDEFLSRNWAQAELKTALSEEISSGQIKVLPIMICEPEKCFAKYPFLRDKKYLSWNDGLNTIINELENILGRSYSKSWEHIYDEDFQGHVWIKIFPKIENRELEHKFIINWGRWQYKNIISFNEDNSIILDFRKITEEKSWPIKIKISPSTFIIFGKGNPVIDINKGWECIDDTGLTKALLLKTFRSIFPDTDEKNAKLLK